MDLSSRIRTAVAHSGKSQAEIAREMGITQSAITQWLSGSTKTLRAESALALEKATGVRAAWIAKGAGPKFVEQRAGVQMSEVQLVSWKQAAMWAAGRNEDDPDDLLAYVRAPVELSDYAFALRIQGNSMFNPAGSPSFADGDLIFVDPDKKPRNDSIVVAVLEGEDHAICRQLVVEGGAQYLQALNPSWPDRILDTRRHPAHIYGTVVAGVTIYE
jgi:SOS-response transcriptional repressor LexA